MKKDRNLINWLFFFFFKFQYVKREIAKFFGVDIASEDRERIKWSERQKRLALRRFGSLKQVNFIIRTVPVIYCIYVWNCLS